MRIASFNVENLAVDRLSDARQTLLRQQLLRLDADILCLQEVDGDDPGGSAPRQLLALEKLIAGTAYNNYSVIHTTNPNSTKPRNKHNLVILSRTAATTHAQHANDFVPPPRYAPVTSDPPGADAEITWDRPILYVCFTLADGRRLHIINMHLKAPSAAAIQGQKLGPYTWKSVSGWAEGYFVAAIKRSGQALEARLLIDRIFDAEPDALLAVCGDFNAEARDISFHIIAGRTEDTGNGLLAARELIPLENGLSVSRRFTVIHAGNRQMLDHILVSRALLATAKGMEIHNEALADELIAYTKVEETFESFHAPIVATFDLGV